MKHPIPVTLAFWAVLILTTWNAVKAWTFIAWSATLEEFSSRYPPVVGAVSGIIWLLAGSVLAWGLWRNKRWSGNMLPVASIGYILWYWVERLLWQAPRPNLPFVITVEAVFLALVYITSKSLSREAYERNSENPAIE